MPIVVSHQPSFAELALAGYEAGLGRAKEKQAELAAQFARVSADISNQTAANQVRGAAIESEQRQAEAALAQRQDEMDLRRYLGELDVQSRREMQERGYTAERDRDERQFEQQSALENQRQQGWYDRLDVRNDNRLEMQERQFTHRDQELLIQRENALATIDAEEAAGRLSAEEAEQLRRQNMQLLAPLYQRRQRSQGMQRQQSHQERLQDLQASIVPIPGPNGVELFQIDHQGNLRAVPFQRERGASLADVSRIAGDFQMANPGATPEQVQAHVQRMVELTRLVNRHEQGGPAGEAAPSPAPPRSFLPPAAVAASMAGLGAGPNLPALAAASEAVGARALGRREAAASFGQLPLPQQLSILREAYRDDPLAAGAIDLVQQTLARYGNDPSAIPPALRGAFQSALVQSQRLAAHYVEQAAGRGQTLRQPPSAEEQRRRQSGAQNWSSFNQEWMALARDNNLDSRQAIQRLADGGNVIAMAHVTGGPDLAQRAAQDPNDEEIHRTVAVAAAREFREGGADHRRIVRHVLGLPASYRDWTPLQSQVWQAFLNRPTPDTFNAARGLLRQQQERGPWTEEQRQQRELRGRSFRAILGIAEGAAYWGTGREPGRLDFSRDWFFPAGLLRQPTRQPAP